MPRERIAGFHDDNPEYGAVEIAWGRVDFDHRDIQLGMGEVAISTAIVNAVPGTTTPSVTVVFDRQRINNLIRVLRRARDQAFGADA